MGVVLVQARNLGVSESKLLGAYPTLRAKDLTNARAYRDELAAQIAVNEAAQ